MSLKKVSREIGLRLFFKTKKNQKRKKNLNFIQMDSEELRTSFQIKKK